MEFLQRARRYVHERHHVGEGYALLRDCVADGGTEALAAVQLLAEERYGDDSYAFERKAPNAYALPRWGARGLDALVENAARTANGQNVALCLSVLGAVAAGVGPGRLRYFAGDGAMVQALLTVTENNDDLRRAARARLTGFVLAFDSDAEAVAAVARQFLLPVDEHIVAAASELCEALAARWLTVGDSVLGGFKSLIERAPTDERALRRFLEANPRVLEPSTIAVWRRPKWISATRPEFVLRRRDDSYLLVELEAPDVAIITHRDQISEGAARAVRRAAKHRTWLIRHRDVAREHLPEFREVDGLVVVGLQGSLSNNQRGALERANLAHREIRIVGFDWLLDRGRTIMRNVTSRVRDGRTRPVDRDRGGAEEIADRDTPARSTAR